MAMAIPGTTAWALIISVTNPVPSEMPRANPPVHVETEVECRSIATAINAKAHEAGVQEQISADCHQIEFMKIPKS